MTKKTYEPKLWIGTVLITYSFEVGESYPPSNYIYLQDNRGTAGTDKSFYIRTIMIILKLAKRIDATTSTRCSAAQI
jgi:hypothetical protein